MPHPSPLYVPLQELQHFQFPHHSFRIHCHNFCHIFRNASTRYFHLLYRSQLLLLHGSVHDLMPGFLSALSGLYYIQNNDFPLFFPAPYRWPLLPHLSPLYVPLQELQHFQFPQHSFRIHCRNSYHIFRNASVQCFRLPYR